MRITTLRKWILTLIIVLLLVPIGTAYPQTETQELSTENRIYLPLVISNSSVVEINDAWIGNTDGIALSTFLPGTPVKYIVTGVNHLDSVTTVDFSWNQTGPCGSGQVVTKTLELDPGIWVDVTPSFTPDCVGVYTATAQITTTKTTSTQSVDFQVNTASIVLSDKQGFDRCNMPSVAEMQTWWDSSPYYVANVYLGGISYDNTSGCSNDNIDTNWMQSVADQGWTFLLAWVGPQAPCSGYRYKMSYDSGISYQQGREEALAAIQAAADIGLVSSIIIYYDVEGYGNATNTACRNAVDSFLQGWTQQLQELGAKSGAYGSPCNSHISDWADNNPPPDDVWIAHWIDNDYNPFATVWDATCLSNDLWPDRQRVRQYAGDHTETWGGLPLRIDSNVLDGEVVALTYSGGITETVGVRQDVTVPEGTLLLYTPELRDLGLISPRHGWVLVDDSLLMTLDGGTRWDDRTPQASVNILDVDFLDASRGWLVHQSEDGLKLLSTWDGGVTWFSVPLPAYDEEIASASLQFNDLENGSLTLRLASGSSFHQVRGLTTQDGGQSWQVGEITSMRIDESIQRLSSIGGNMPDGVILMDWYDEETAWAVAQQGTCQGAKYPIGSTISQGAKPWQCQLRTQLWMTVDGGLNWQEITPD